MLEVGVVNFPQIVSLKLREGGDPKYIQGILIEKEGQRMLALHSDCPAFQVRRLRLR